ncbi:mechanosensitive ion channel domain-containing protein [Breoghania sp.]|uniref:mechanosensitive ion channel family protein n=1 Tax=Breoghania sp. TaxID=2065378 RepID=UPI002AAA98E4|nr:mechanosensitive ion channel domain-containing protein [Breoghania sp.]
MFTWEEFVKAIESTVPQLVLSLRALIQPSGILQLVILILAFAVAHYGALRAEPHLENWVRAQETSIRRMRFLALVLRRLRVIIFVAITWAVVVVMREVTWPSRSYLILVVGNLAAVWLVISISSRIIRNRLAARIVALGGWAFAALTLLDLTPQAIVLMDALAVQVGSLRISLLLVVKAVVTLTLLMWMAGWLSRAAERRMEREKDLSPSMKVLAGKLTRIALFMLAAVLGLQTIGFDLTTITVFSGAVGLGLGFGLQKVVSNLVSGVILLIDKSIKPGDVISVGETYGSITSLGARYVSVVTRDAREYLIPNEDLITNQVINWTYSDNKVRLDVPFGVAYDADPAQVRELAARAAASVARVEDDPAPVCHLTAFGESSVDFLLRFWIDDPGKGVVNVKGEVLMALWEALHEAGVGLPYRQHDIHIKGPVEMIYRQPGNGPQDGDRREPGDE